MAAPTSFVYQGQIIKPDLNPLDAASVDFTVEIYSNDGNECLLYEETHNLNMSGSSGIFSLTIGSGGRSGVSYEDTSTIPQILDNSQAPITPLTCTVGNTYAPSAGDTRRLRLTFNDGSGPVTVASDHIVQSVPYAEYASRVGGLAASDLVQVNTSAPQVLSQSNLEWVFETARYAELQALINGTSAQYISSTPTSTVDFNGQVLDDLGAPVDADDATTKGYVDGQIAGGNINAAVGAPGAGQDGMALVWNNGAGEWQLQTPSGTDNTKLPLDGSSAMTGNLQLGANRISNDGGAGDGLAFDATGNGTFGQDLTVGGGFAVTNGINSSGSINLLTQNELRLEDDAGGEYIGLQAPTGVTSYTMQLPNVAGTTNQILKSDAAGNLSWQADNDTVFTPAAGDYTAADVDNVVAGNIAGTNVQLAIDELDSEKVAKAGDSMSGQLDMLTENEIRFQDNAGGEYIGFKAPANVTGSQTFTLPPADGSANQVLKTNGSGVLTWQNDNDTAFTPSAGDYTAADVDNVAAGNIAGTNVQLALNELDSEKVAKAGDSMAGNLSMQTQSELRLEDDAGGEYIGLQAPTGVTSYTMQLPNVAGTTNQILKSDAAGNLSWQADNDTVFTPAASDYDANQIDNTPAGNIAATEVQAAIDELDSEKVAKAGDSMTGNLALQTESEVRYEDAAGGEYVGFKAPATVTISETYTLPPADGSNGQVLKTDGSGNLTWQNDNSAAAGTITDGGNGLGQIIELGTTDAFDLILLAGNNTAVQINDATLQADFSGDINMLAEGEVRYQDNAGGEYVGFKAPATVTSSQTYTLPAADGTANQVLKTNGSGILTWQNDNDTAFTPSAGDYTAADVDNVAAGNIAGTNVQLAINELDSEKVAKAGDTMAGNLSMQTQSELRLEDDAGGEYIGLQAPTGVTSYTMQLPNVAGTTNQILKSDAAGNLSWQADNDTVFTPAASDYDANQIDNTPAGNIAATEVQAALNELDSEKVAKSGDSMSGQLDMLTENEVRFQDAAGGDYIGFKAPATVTGSQTFTLPPADGANGQVLKTNGSGVLTWQNDNSAAAGTITDGGNGLGQIIELGTTDAFDLILLSGNNTAVQFDDATQRAEFSGDINMLAEGEVRYQDNTGGEYVGFKAPATVTSSQTYTLPPADGTANQVLKTNGSGVLTWQNDVDNDTVFTPSAGDYTAADVDNVASGNIAGTNVQLAINELDSEKVAKAGDSMAGNLSMQTQSELRLEDDAGGEYVGLRAPTGVTSYTMDLPPVVGTTNQILKSDAAGNLSWQADNDTVFTPAASDYDANQIDNTPAGNIAATEVQAALNELDSEKVAKSGDSMSGQLDMLTENEVRFQDAAGGDFIGFKAPATVTGSQTFTLPPADGANGQVLKTNGSGVLTWQNDNSAAAGTITDGGNGLGEIIELGTQDAFDLVLLSGNNTAVQFDDASQRADFSGDVNVLAEGEVRYQDNSGGEYVGFKAPATVTSSQTYTLPPADGSANQVLETNGSGVLSWVTPASGTGDISDGGNAGAISVGSTNNTFDLLSNGTSRMQIEADGDINFDSNTLFVDNDTNAVGIGTSLATFPLDVFGTGLPMRSTRDTAVDTRVEVLQVEARNSGGAGGAGLGPEISFAAETSTTNGRDIGRINVVLTDATDATRTSDMQFYTSESATMTVPQMILSGAGDLEMQAENEIRFEDASGGQYVGFKAPATVTGSQTYTLPPADGSANQVLETNGSGVLSWVTPASGGASDIDGLSDGDTSSGTSVVFLGDSAGNSNSGNYNSGVGDGAMFRNSSGNDNTVFGNQAFYNNSTGSDNVAIGRYAGQGVNGSTVANRNTLIGNEAGQAITTADENTFIGGQSGNTTTTGDRNIIIGYNVQASSATASDELNIGNILRGDISTGNIAIGTATTSSNRLEIYDSFTAASSSYNMVEQTLNVNPSSVSGWQGFVGNNATTYANGSNNAQNSFYGGYFNSINNTATNTNYIIGVTGAAINWNGGANSYGTGVYSRIENTGNGSIGDARGVDSSITNTSTGSIPIARGLYSTITNTGGGSITTGYGIYLDDNQATNDYGVYQTDAGADNYFNGNVGLGDNSPEETLTVNGGIKVGTAEQATDGTIQFSGGNLQVYSSGWQTLSTGGGATNIDGLSDGRTSGGGADVLFLGTNAGAANTTGGDENIGVGTNALTANTTGDWNIAIGVDALAANQTGNRNIAIGPDVLAGGTGDLYNTAIGYQAMQFGSGMLRNTALGHSALRSPNGGDDNVAIGYGSMQQSRGASNTIVGTDAGYANNTVNNNNVIMGYGAGYLIDTADDNVFLGYQAGETTTTGDGNILIGSGVDASAAGASNELNIGNAIRGNLSSGDINIENELRLDNDANNQYVALKAPDAAASSVTYTLPAADGSANQVLQTNGSGVLSWATPSGGSEWTAIAGPKIYYNSGNVGIGTNDPGSYRLNVEGGDVRMVPNNANSEFYGRFDTFDIADNGNDQTYFIYASDGYAADPYNLGMQGATKVEIGESNGTRRHTIASSAAAADTDTIFGVAYSTDSGSTYNPSVVVKGNGDVGIGTNNPSSKLHIHAGELELSGTGAYFDYKPNNSECAGGQILEWDATNDRWICANGGSEWTAIAGPEIYYDSGNVGIGTNNPAATLDVRAGKMQLTSTSNGNEIRLIDTDGDELVSARDLYGHGRLLINDSNGTGALSLGPHNNTNANYMWLGTGLTLSGNYVAQADLDVNGDVVIRDELRFNDAANDNYVGFVAPNTLTANEVWTLPATDGTSGQILSTNGSGVLSWATASSGDPNFAGEDSAPTVTATGTDSIAAGPGASATGNNGVAFGVSATASNLNSIAIGESSSGSATGAISIGADSSATGNSALAIGDNADATGADAVAIGRDAAAAVDRLHIQWAGGTGDIFGDSSGNVGIGLSTMDEKLHVNGSVKGVSFVVSSDRALKRDIATEKSSLDKILSLRGVSYYLRTEDYPDREFSEKLQHGLIAQEVREIYPELVNGEDGDLAVNYTGLIGPMIEAIKEQNHMCVMSEEERASIKAMVVGNSRDIASLKKENKSLKKRLKAQEDRLDKQEQKIEMLMKMMNELKANQ